MDKVQRTIEQLKQNLEWGNRHTNKLHDTIERQGIIIKSLFLILDFASKRLSEKDAEFVYSCLGDIDKEISAIESTWKE
jgi:hypothetical protein